MSTSVKAFPGAHNSRGGDSLTQRLATLTGRTPAGCSQEVYSERGVFAKAARWAYKLRRAGAKELAFRKAQEIVAEAIGDEHPPVTKRCLAEVERPAAEELVARVELIADNDWTQDELDDYLRYLDKKLLPFLTLRAKVVARIQEME